MFVIQVTLQIYHSTNVVYVTGTMSPSLGQPDNGDSGVHLKHWILLNYSVTYQSTVIFLLTAIKTSHVRYTNMHYSGVSLLCT